MFVWAPLHFQCTAGMQYNLPKDQQQIYDIFLHDASWITLLMRGLQQQHQQHQTDFLIPHQLEPKESDGCGRHVTNRHS